MFPNLRRRFRVLLGLFPILRGQFKSANVNEQCKKDLGEKTALPFGVRHGGIISFEAG